VNSQCCFRVLVFFFFLLWISGAAGLSWQQVAFCINCVGVMIGEMAGVPTIAIE
jgi:hypothetical protein